MWHLYLCSVASHRISLSILNIKVDAFVLKNCFEGIQKLVLSSQVLGHG
jgi:hypothetical protein